MYKDTKWAKQIISLQEDDGKWGWFHSLSQFSNSSITTEQALRRLERLGYTIEDECIQKAVSYMNDCLIGENEIPDRKEKAHDWSIFTSLMLATWIRRFTCDNLPANQVAKKWADVISGAFISGTYHHEAYVSAYYDIWKPKGGRLVDFMNFYHISLLTGGLEEETELAFMDYVMQKDGGIYYIYGDKLCILPQNFESKKASYYLAAIELVSKYTHARHQLDFVVEWLNSNKNGDGTWDMGKTVNDKIYFPLSNDWRKRETREADCTERITRLIGELSGQIG
jgi:hypothetical protein